LADVTVSRRHLKVIREGNLLRLRDLGSGNGTQVNGQRASQVSLYDGDRIEVGETVLVVHLPAAGASSAELTSSKDISQKNELPTSLPPPAHSLTPVHSTEILRGPGYAPKLTPPAIPLLPEPAPSRPTNAVVLP